jgi:hypothetical protein
MSTLFASYHRLSVPGKGEQRPTIRAEQEGSCGYFVICQLSFHFLIHKIELLTDFVGARRHDIQQLSGSTRRFLEERDLDSTAAAFFRSRAINIETKRIQNRQK